MKKLLTLLCLLAALPAPAQSILRQFGTTNTGPVLTNIILSMVVSPTNGTTPTQVTNIVADNSISRISGGFGTNTTIHGSLVTPTLFTDNIFSTNASSMLITNAVGQSLNFGSGTLTLSGSAGGFSGVGVNLTALNASQLTSGTVPTARLGSGTANSSSFLRGDQTWAAATGSGIDTNQGSGIYNTFSNATVRVQTNFVGSAGVYNYTIAPTNTATGEQSILRQAVKVEAQGTNAETTWMLRSINMSPQGVQDQTNFFSLFEQVETHWDQFYPSHGELNQMEFYREFRSRTNTTSSGAPYRYYGEVLRDNNLLANYSVDRFEWYRPGQGVPDVIIDAGRSGGGASLEVNGVITADNDENNAGQIFSRGNGTYGGSILAASYNDSAFLRLLGDSAGVYASAGAESAIDTGLPALRIVAPVKVMISTNTYVFGNIVSSNSYNRTSVATNGFSSDVSNFTLMPTNTPTDGQVLTAAGTAGYTKWAAGGAGGTPEYANGQDLFGFTASDSARLLDSAGATLMNWVTAGGQFQQNFGTALDGTLALNNSGMEITVPASAGVSFEVTDLGIRGTGPAFSLGTLIGINASTGFWESIGTLATLMVADLVVTTSAVGNGSGLTNVSKTTYSATLGTDDTHSGASINGLNAGATVAQWEAVYLSSGSEWVLTDANGSGTYPAIGLAITAGTDNNPLNVAVAGTVRNDAWAWTPGGAVYISTTPGGLTQSAPSTTGDKVQVVGFALTADVLYLNPSTDYGTAP